MRYHLNNGDRATLPLPQLTAILDELGKCITRYALLARDLGWGSFFI